MPDLPPLPRRLRSEGFVSGESWALQYAVNREPDGSVAVDFLAFGPGGPIFGHVASDGTVEELPWFREYSSYDPEVEDESAGLVRQRAHNATVSAELARRRLIAEDDDGDG